MENNPNSRSFKDPTYRIGKLAIANKPPVSVYPQTVLQEAITIMLANDISQIAVMASERDVRGMVSWKSIGSRLALGYTCKIVNDCIDRHYEVSADDSLFQAIRLIARHGYVLVRDSTKRICGIVTVYDLSQQFGQFVEPFLLVGEIENYIRHLIDGKFTADELASIKDPSDTRREINGVLDLTFGEYVRLLENPRGWTKLELQIDRKIFVKHLDEVRRIRNDVMHFDPKGIAEDDLNVLRRFVQFFQQLNEIDRGSSSNTLPLKESS